MTTKTDLTTTFYAPRTVPALSRGDLSPYHYVTNHKGNLSLRKGPHPKDVRKVASDFVDGNASLDTFLDRLGVPKT